MKGSKMSVFRKVIFVIWVLYVLAATTFTILDTTGVLTGIDMLEDINDCVLWLLTGIVFWEKERLFPIICFVFSGLKLIFIFI